MAEMRTHVGVTPDRKRVTIALFEDNKQLGWIEFTGAQCDQFMTQVARYRAMLTDAPAPAAPPSGAAH